MELDRAISQKEEANNSPSVPLQISSLEFENVEKTTGH
jgi:hypothetical protein